jgi:hypothetical protein
MIIIFLEVEAMDGLLGGESAANAAEEIGEDHFIAIVLCKFFSPTAAVE